MLKEVPFPPAVLAEFEGQVINGNSNKLIHRVSDQCFVVQTMPSSEAPLGLLHVRVDAKKQFQCSCHKFKCMTSLCGATTAPKVSKRCIHVYLCLWAVFSSDLLNEFPMFLFDGVLAKCYLIILLLSVYLNNIDTTTPPDSDSLSAPSDSQAGTTSSENGN